MEYSMVPEAQIAGAKKAVPRWRDRSFFYRFKDTQNKLQVSTSGGLPQWRISQTGFEKRETRHV